MLICERVLKKLIQHGWPASYELQASNRLFPTVAIWSNELGLTPEFLAALDRAIAIVAGACRVPFLLSGAALSLVGEWVVRLRSHGGKVVAATIHPAPDCPF